MVHLNACSIQHCAKARHGLDNARVRGHALELCRKHYADVAGIQLGQRLKRTRWKHVFPRVFFSAVWCTSSLHEPER